jgi:serine phosphatase RsbU (regulator of sigma subunit)/CHASE3 domain sensor protein
MAVVVVGLVLAGLFVRSIVASSFNNDESVRVARILVADVLRQQLDEETGLRGYGADRKRILLQPYYKGRVGLPRARSRVARVLERLRMEDALAILQDAALTNRRWLDEVALPLLAPEPGPQSLELRGKKLVDHFRADIASLQMLLARREASSDAGAQRAILLVGFFAFGAPAAVTVAALLFTIQQYRLSVRLERERENAEVERRHSAEIRAAYEAEKRIAETLQGAFVQNVLPEPAMLRLGATYLPAAEESKIGGDWYDAFELPDGRVLMAIGDVAGHGIDAAVAMNATRQLLMSCALIDPRPGPVLERVNAELFRNQSPLVTAMAALVDAGKCEFDYAVAGHPPAVLLEPGRSARFLEVGSLPLGVLGSAAYRTHRVRSVPGALVVLYTDGAIEHSRDVVAGEELLLAAVESAAQASPANVAAAIRYRIFDDRKATDDVAILTLRFAERRKGRAAIFEQGSQTTVAAGTKTGHG